MSALRLSPLRHPAYRCAVWLGVLVGVAALSAVPEAARAQRPFASPDPFYRSETAPRTFFDGYAVSMEVAYRPAGSVQADGLASTAPNPLGLSFRLDYQLTPHFDLSGIVDASGGTLGRSTLLSWVVLKYYWHVDGTDHALRLAVDPALSSRGGFHQVDLAFVSTTPLSPVLGADFALGMRRVRLGYERLASAGDASLFDSPVGAFSSSAVMNDGADLLFLTTQAVGTELHLMMRYHLQLDLAESHAFAELLGQGGRYDLITTPRVSTTEAAESAPTPQQDDWRGGVVWIRAGLALSRPNYQFSPFVAVPVQEWAPSDPSVPKARLRLGARLMLR